jgi:methyl-accepting chemotaxis protein
MKWRIVLPVGVALVVGIGAIVAIIAVNYSTAMTDAVNTNLEATAYRYANRIKADLEMSLGGVKSLKSVIAGEAGTPEANRAGVTIFMKDVLLENDRLFGVWCAFEPNAFDGRDAEFAGQAPFHDATGRYIPSVYKADDGTAAEDHLVGYDTPGDGDYYLLPFARKRATIVAPYIYESAGVMQYLCTVAEPAVRNDRSIGVIGGDLRLQPICDFLRSVKLFDTGFLTLIDQNGNIVYHPDNAAWTKPAPAVLTAAVADRATEVGKSGTTAIFEGYDASGMANMYAVCPVDIGDTGERWIMMSVVPESEAMASVRSGVALTVIVGVAALAVSLVLLYLLVSPVVRVLTGIGNRLSNASLSVSEAAGSIAGAGNELAEGATEQASSLEETSSALEQMASMTRQNADNATRTDQTNHENNKMIADGAVAVRNMSEAMGAIDESAEKISRIIKTIEEIAFQTNLLALTAAVEAARAGEAGKGFAVVADEVRNLAGRSAQAAKDTVELISGTISRVKTGTDIAARLSDGFKGIEEGANTVAGLITQIASATNEQALGMDQINSAVAQMDKVTQQNAANAEETASVTETLNGQAEELQQLVGDLTRLITGSDGNGNGTAKSAPRPHSSRPAHLLLPAPGGKG